jgi:photosystem II stability/assembly factor-like uncharacterized protein
MHFSDDKNGIAIGNLASSIGYVMTENGGQTWNFTRNSRNDLYRLYFSDPDTGIVIMTNNWALFTNDGGKSFHSGDWTPPFVGQHSSHDYYMVNSKTMYSVGWVGNISRSINGGKTWEKYQGFDFINAMYAVTCPSANVCYACGDVAKVIKTTDGGKSWVEQNVLLNNTLKAICFIDNNTGFAGGQYGALIRTADGGINWEIKTSGLKYTIIEIYFSDRNTGYAVSSAGGIVKTTDGGNTWSLTNKEQYGVTELYNVYFRGNIVWGVGGAIYKYDLLQ